MNVQVILLLLAAMLGGTFAASAEESRYSKAVRKACGADYHKYCGEYGIETAALRNCMDKRGQSLSKTCVRALVDAGEVSQAEVIAGKNPDGSYYLFLATCSRWS